MIGLVLVAHGDLAKGFVSAAETISGPQSHVQALCMQQGDDMEQKRQDLLQAVQEVDQGKGVILLTDLFGGTPSNLAISVLGRAATEVLAGLNLPMLLKLLSIRGKVTLKEAVEQAQEAGRKYIHVASNLL